MRPLSIRSGSISVRLSPKQCNVLAAALWYAYRTHHSDNLGSDPVDSELYKNPPMDIRDLGEPDIDHWYTLGILFQACAVAGYAQQHLSPQDEQVLDTQLAEGEAR